MPHPLTNPSLPLSLSPSLPLSLSPSLPPSLPLSLIQSLIRHARTYRDFRTPATSAR